MPVQRTIKFTAPAAGEHEIQIPDDFLHKEEVAAQYSPREEFQSEIARRVASITKELKKPEDLLKDDDFAKKLVETRKDDLITMLGLPKPGEMPDITKISTEAMERVRRDEVTPLATQLQSATTEIQALRYRDMDAQALDAMNDLNVVKDLTDLVKMYVREKMAWDPDRKQWFVKKLDGTEGFEFSSDPKKNGHPYKTVRELLSDTARDPSKKAWFNTKVQDGPGFRGTGADAGTLTPEQYNKLSPAEKTKYAQTNPKEFDALMVEMQRAGEEKLYARR